MEPSYGQENVAGHVAAFTHDEHCSKHLVHAGRALSGTHAALAA
ncbi:MAG TPA: hypothetical protein VHB21_10975 [Minicystis sp.]|nr:hypothetical protein [Minicystis sp.]